GPVTRLNNHTDRRRGGGPRGLVGTAAGGPRTVDRPKVRGEDRERRRERAARVGERDARRFGDIGKAEPLDRLFGEQRHEGVDDALAFGFAGARGGTGGWLAR